MKLTSLAFEQNQPIPVQYTCDGVNHHPSLTFSQVPEEAQSLALVVEDPDAPAKVFTHWLIYDIPPSIQHIPEHEVPLSGTVGVNDLAHVAIEDHALLRVHTTMSLSSLPLIQD